MSMSKKDFEALADVLRHAREDVKPDWTVEDVLDYVQHGIKSVCLRSNPAFDLDRFDRWASV